MAEAWASESMVTLNEASQAILAKLVAKQRAKFRMDEAAPLQAGLITDIPLQAVDARPGLTVPSQPVDTCEQPYRPPLRHTPWQTPARAIPLVVESLSAEPACTINVRGTPRPKPDVLPALILAMKAKADAYIFPGKTAAQQAKQEANPVWQRLYEQELQRLARMAENIQQWRAKQ